MRNLNKYITEKLSINKNTKVKKVKSEEEIKKESEDFIVDWMRNNTSYKDRGSDYDISIKNDYLFVFIYSAERKELEDIGDKLTHALQEEKLICEYYELGSTNKTLCYKKLIFHLNIERIISRDDFYKTTFKRTKRF